MPPNAGIQVTDSVLPYHRKTVSRLTGSGAEVGFGARRFLRRVLRACWRRAIRRAEENLGEQYFSRRVMNSNHADSTWIWRAER